MESLFPVLALGVKSTKPTDLENSVGVTVKGVWSREKFGGGGL